MARTFKKLKKIGLKKFKRGTLKRARKTPISKWTKQQTPFSKSFKRRPLKRVRKGLTSNRKKFRRRAKDNLDDLFSLNNLKK